MLFTDFDKIINKIVSVNPDIYVDIYNVNGYEFDGIDSIEKTFSIDEFFNFIFLLKDEKGESLTIKDFKNIIDCFSIEHKKLYIDFSLGESELKRLCFPHLKPKNSNRVIAHVLCKFLKK